MAVLRWDGPRAKSDVRNEAPHALLTAAEVLLEEANRTVPFEEGILAESGDTDVDDGRLLATVSYDTPYAVRQHEDTRLRHDPGRRAKWLEHALRENADDLIEVVADDLRRRLNW